MNYKKYLHSRHWKTTKFLLYSTKKRCSLCRSKKNLNIHHKTYSRLGNENPSDLILLCQECHYLYHEYARTIAINSDSIGRIRLLYKQGCSREMAIRIGTHRKAFNQNQRFIKKYQYPEAELVVV